MLRYPLSGLPWGSEETLMGRRRRLRRGHVVAAALLVVAGMATPLAAYGEGTWVSPAIVNGAASAPPACAAGMTCVRVDATDVLGPVDLVAQGLLFGVDDTTSQALVDALHPTSWRIAGAGQPFSVARSSGAAVTDILSDQWYNSHPGPNVQPPWDNWPAYATWLQQTVKATMAAGQIPDYWEVQNEPDGWYQSIPPESTDQALYQYQLATGIIRSIVPNAKIEGPSLLGFFDTPGQPTIDMTTFLAFVNAHNLPLDALSWHEVIGAAVDRNPDIVVTHVAQARFLLSKYPRLAHIPIFVNEYSSNATHLIPGWAVGWMAALEQAGVAEASRACWHEPDVFGNSIAECNEGGLDGLLQPGSGLPQDLYWVHAAYGSMTGDRVATTSTDPNVSAYATYDPTTGTIAVLVGRHASCTAAVRVDCTEPASATPPPEPVVVQIRTPRGWVAASVETSQIANTPGPQAPPVAVPAGVLPASQLDIPLGGSTGFVDGDAYGITVSNL